MCTHTHTHDREEKRNRGMEGGGKIGRKKNRKEREGWIPNPFRQGWSGGFPMELQILTKGNFGQRY